MGPKAAMLKKKKNILEKNWRMEKIGGGWGAIRE